MGIVNQPAATVPARAGQNFVGKLQQQKSGPLSKLVAALLSHKLVPIGVLFCFLRVDVFFVMFFVPFVEQGGAESELEHEN